MARIDVFGLTDVGKKRKHNEDAFALDGGRGPLRRRRRDGRARGRARSRRKITVETIGEFFAATRPEGRERPGRSSTTTSSTSTATGSRVAIEKANERVMAAVAAQPWLKGMGTTVVARAR